MKRRFGLSVILAVGMGACSPGPASSIDLGPLPGETRVCPVFPEALSFGQVPVGGEATQLLAGAEGEVVLEGAPEFSVVLEAQALRFTVRPVGTGVVSARVTVRSAQCGEATLRLTAEGMAPCLLVAPSLQFADAARNCGSVTEPLVLENRCPVPVLVQSIDIDEAPDAESAWCAGGAPCREFGVVAGEGRLAAGGSTTLTVRFNPADDGVITGVLTLQALERDGTASYPVAVRGRGLPRPTITEVFDAPPLPRGDLLIVLDTSPSMAARQDSVRRNLAHFARYLVATQQDVVVTLTSADRSAPNVFARLSTLAPDFEARFAQAVESLPPGTEDTSCLEQALRQLEATPSFRHEGVPAAVLCITDGPDRTPAPWLGLLGRFTSRMDTPVMMIVGPFVPVAGCPTDLDDGRLASLSEGPLDVREEICAPDWSGALENLARQAFGFWFEAALAQPVLRIVRVAVDGVAVPSIDVRGARIWDWDSARNRVVFSPLYVPGPGQQVSVTYEPTCP